MDEAFEHEGCIHGATSCFGMELHGRPRFGLVDDTLVSIVVGVREESLPALRKGGRVNGESAKKKGKKVKSKTKKS